MAGRKKEQKKEDLERLIYKLAEEMGKVFYQEQNPQCLVHC